MRRVGAEERRPARPRVLAAALQHGLGMRLQARGPLALLVVAPGVAVRVVAHRPAEREQHLEDLAAHVALHRVPQRVAAHVEPLLRLERLAREHEHVHGLLQRDQRLAERPLRVGHEPAEEEAAQRDSERRHHHVPTRAGVEALAVGLDDAHGRHSVAVGHNRAARLELVRDRELERLVVAGAWVYERAGPVHHDSVRQRFDRGEQSRDGVILGVRADELALGAVRVLHAVQPRAVRGPHGLGARQRARERGRPRARLVDLLVRRRAERGAHAHGRKPPPDSDPANAAAAGLGIGVLGAELFVVCLAVAVHLFHGSLHLLRVRGVVRRGVARALEGVARGRVALEAAKRDKRAVVRLGLERLGAALEARFCVAERLLVRADGRKRRGAVRQ